MSMCSDIVREELMTEQTIPGIIDLLKCGLCKHIMFRPVQETKNDHIFCQDCVKSTPDKLAICPLCQEIVLFKPAVTLQKVIDNLEFQCPQVINGCNWVGSCEKLNLHIEECEINIEQASLKLGSYCRQIKELLKKEVTPHLKHKHPKIYKEQINQWNFLYSEDKEWSWWWGVQNPWWNNKLCKTCNYLYHIRCGEEINKIDESRRQLLKIFKKTDK